MNEFNFMNVLIYVSVITCVIVTLISAFIIYRRDSKSREHIFYALFFIGIAGLVAFYLFLQNPALMEYSYFFQTLCVSILIFGLFLFYYTIAHEGNVPTKVLLFCAGSLFTPPILCLIFHPYTFIEEWYGVELSISSWFMILVNVVFLSFGLITVLGLLWVGLKTEDPALKRKLKMNFLGLLIITIASVLFFVIVPVFFSLHYLKPVGYFLITIGIVIMAYSFIGHK